MSIESAIILLPTLGRVDIGEAIGKIIDALKHTEQGIGIERRAGPRLVVAYEVTHNRGSMMILKLTDLLR